MHRIFLAQVLDSATCRPNRCHGVDYPSPKGPFEQAQE
jgi:hypothetical protein